MAKVSGWSIGAFYKNAWQIVKTHKLLWIFGIASAAGSSFNLQSQGNIDSETISKIFQESQGKDSVLGDSTSVLLENISHLFSSVPVWVYVIVGLEILILGLAAIALAIIFQNWSTATLLLGIQAAIHNQKVSIRTASEHAFPRIIPLIKATIIPYFLFAAVSAIIFLVLLAGITLSGSGLQVIFRLLMVVVAIAFFVGLLLLTLTMIWAMRAVVLDHEHPVHAVKHGFRLAKTNFWRMLGLGIVNLLAGIVVVAVPVAIVVGIFAAVVLTMPGSGFPSMELLVLGGVLILAFIILLQVLGGIITAFKATVWSLAYQMIHKHD